MKNAILILFLFMIAGGVCAQAIVTVRVDSLARNQWYFVRSRQTILPDSTVVVDEQKQYFPNKKAVRDYVTTTYQVEITRDSIEQIRLKNQFLQNKATRKALLISIKN